MKLRTTALLSVAATALAVTGLAFAAAAQEGERRGPPPHERGHHGPDLSEVDLDGDGNITRAEIDAARAARFAEADADGSGGISQEEFAAQAEALEAERKARHQAAMFARLDKNGDGVIAADENGDRLSTMFDRIDSDGDGVLTQAERDAARTAMRARFGERREREHRGSRGQGDETDN